MGYYTTVHNTTRKEELSISWKNAHPDPVETSIIIHYCGWPSTDLLRVPLDLGAPDCYFLYDTFEWVTTSN